MSAQTSEQAPLCGLTGPQQEGWTCALCGHRLFADRSLGVHRILSCGQETDVELWACAPSCEDAAAQRRRQTPLARQAGWPS